jgi:hypothetical protein
MAQKMPDQSILKYKLQIVKEMIKTLFNLSIFLLMLSIRNSINLMINMLYTLKFYLIWLKPISIKEMMD